MEIPKSVEHLIEMRMKYAIKLMDAEMKLDEWLDKHGICCDSADTHGGCEIYVHPIESAIAVREAILNHKRPETWEELWKKWE